VTEPLQITHLDTTRTGLTTLEVTLQGVTDGAHQVHVILNGADVGTVSFDGTQHPTKKFTVNRSVLLEGGNSVQLVSTGGDADVSLFDSVRLTYAHTYVADNNRLSFVFNRSRQVRVDGFSTASIRVVDITNASAPEEMASAIQRGANGTYSATITEPANESSNNQRTIL